jgi:heptosyltransferase-2
MILKTDCKFFPGDRPCIFNKSEGIICSSCSHYSPIQFKILIIKLDAIGDVLRTTSILPAVKRKYPNAHITWLTKKSSKEIFVNNNYVDELLIFESEDLFARLASIKFDLVLHPDTSPVSASLASFANGEKKKGFILDSNGKVAPVDEAGVEWIEMGAFDQFKKQNKKTYQQIIHNILGLEYLKDKIIIKYTEKEKAFASDFYNKNKLDRFKFLIGLNTGSSHRWQLKQWPEEKFYDLIQKLNKYKELGILLFGGKDEAEKNKHLMEAGDNVIDTGSNNSLREFFALMGLPSLVLTGDTLALHTAAALGKKTICMFGPTSSAEIEDYGIIKKISPEMDCLVCYKNSCNFKPNCMDLISTDYVLKMIEKETGII